MPTKQLIVGAFLAGTVMPLNLPSLFWREFGLAMIKNMCKFLLMMFVGQDNGREIVDERILTFKQYMLNTCY